jgi:hypothetical protein
MQIYCQNVHGLQQDKWHSLLPLLETGTDLILLSEHWWVGTESWLNHPSTALVSSHPSLDTIRPFSQTTGHLPGGLVVIAAPTLKPRIRLLSRSVYHIYFTLDCTRILFVYFPPSLSEKNIEEILSPISPPPDIFLGDMNFKLGAITGEKERGPLPRLQLIEGYSFRFNLQLVIAENWQETPSRYDHLYSRLGVQTKWAFRENPDVYSDHHAMYINVAIELEKAERPPQTRYHIKRLRDELVQERYQRCYDRNFAISEGSGRLARRIRRFEAEFRTNRANLAEIQECIDTFNSQLVENVLIAAEQILGTYEVSSKRLAEDVLLEQVSEAHSNVDATILFKRAQRGNQKPLQPTNENENIYDEAKRTFRDIWANHESDFANFDDRRNHDAPIDIDISIEHIKQVIMRYPSTKSPGSDGIHAVMIKHLVETAFLDDIQALYQACYRFCVTPASWNAALTCLLAKEPDDPVITKTRPISLTQMFRRFFESLLHDSWREKAWSNLHVSQAGCRDGYSTTTQIMVNDTLSKQGRKHTVLLDIRKAFDSVRHIDILKTLQRLGCSWRTLAIVRSLFTRDMTTQLIINGVLSEILKLTNGIFQGSVLSPFLFELWIDPLALQLNETSTSFDKALFFVDDIVLKARNIVVIIAMIKICEAWSIAMGILFNPTKCVVIPPDGEPPPLLQIYGQDLIVKTSDKYLGAQINHSGLLVKSTIQRQVTKANGILNYLKLRGESWPEWIKVHIYKAFVDSQTNYLAPVFHTWLNHRASVADKQEVMTWSRTLLDSAFKWIFDTTSNTDFVLFKHMTLLQEPVDKWEEHHAKFLHSLDRIAPHNPFITLALGLGTGPWSPSLLLPRLLLKTQAYKDFISLPGFQAQQQEPQAHQEARAVLGLIDLFPDLDPARPVPEFARHILWRRNWNADRDRPKDFSIDTFLRNRRIKKQRALVLVKHRYILGSARRKTLTQNKYANSKMDKCISIRDNKLRKDAISWRRGALFIRRPCPSCNSTFNRRHIHECGLLDDFKGFHPLHHILLDRDRRMLALEAGAARVPAPEHYTILDTLLNHQEYDTFHEAVKYLETVIFEDDSATRRRSTASTRSLIQRLRNS